MISLEPPRSTADPQKDWAAWGLSHAGLTRFVNRAQAAVGLAGEVDVLLAGDRTLRRLNRQYRGKDKATDVLSFPPHPEFSGGHAGDLAISLQTAARQARQYRTSLRDEVRLLILHGFLHLAGMDHEADSGEMAAREAKLRSELRLPAGLIGRVEDEAKRPSASTAQAHRRSDKSQADRKRGRASSPVRKNRGIA